MSCVGDWGNGRTSSEKYGELDREEIIKPLWKSTKVQAAWHSRKEYPLWPTLKAFAILTTPIAIRFL